jgi:hypothetical protein
LQAAVKFKLEQSRPSRLKQVQARNFAKFDPHKFNADPLKQPKTKSKFKLSNLQSSNLPAVSLQI